MDAVIFDMDGVLVDVQQENYEAWSLALEAEGYTLSRQQFDELVGLKGEEIAKTVVGESGEDDIHERVKKRKTELFLENVNSVTPLEGVREVLEELFGQYELAVATSGSDRRAKAIIQEIDIGHYFNHIVTAGDVSKGKPNPEVILTTAEQLDVPVERAVVIEDSPHGIQAAQRAGASVVSVATTYQESEINHADVVVEHPDRINAGVVESIDSVEGV